MLGMGALRCARTAGARAHSAMDTNRKGAIRFSFCGAVEEGTQIIEHVLIPAHRIFIDNKKKDDGQTTPSFLPKASRKELAAAHRMYLPMTRKETGISICHEPFCAMHQPRGRIKGIREVGFYSKITDSPSA